MRRDFALPKLSSTMEEATVTEWLKAPGEYVQAGEPFVEVETDKATMQVEAPEGGYLVESLAEPGEVIAVGAVLARFADQAELPQAHGAQAAHGEQAAHGPQAAPAEAVEGSAGPPVASSTEMPAAGRPGRAPGERILASPSARRLARQHSVDLAALAGSGPGGRIVQSDIPAAPAVRPPADAAPEPVRLSASGGLSLGPGISAMRRSIASAVSRSRREIPSFWSERWVAADRLLELRAAINQTAPVRVTLTDFLLKAMADALAAHPRFSVVLVEQDGQLVEQPAVPASVGLVVALPDGLMIPTLDRLGSLSVQQVAAKRQEAVASVRQGLLPGSARQVAAISLSNLGGYGVDRFEAIIQPGQTAMLAAGRVRERVVAEGRSMAVRSGLSLVLSVDHRLIDGVAAAQYLATLAGQLEHGTW